MHANERLGKKLEGPNQSVYFCMLSDSHPCFSLLTYCMIVPLKRACALLSRVFDDNGLQLAVGNRLLIHFMLLKLKNIK